MPAPPLDLRPSPDFSPSLAAALQEVDEALEGVWAYPYDGMWLVVLVAQVFWSLLFFDMIGDVYGYEAGLQAMIATMLCLPLLTYWLVRIGIIMKSYSTMSGCSAVSQAVFGLEPVRPEAAAASQTQTMPALPAAPSAKVAKV